LRVALGEVTKQYEAIRNEIDSAIREVIESGRFILGEQVTRLEEEIAEMSGARFAVGMNSGTDALLLSLVAYGIGPGDEVITSPFTFVATAEAIALCGATPIFADIDPQTFNLCPDKVKAVITPRTRAIMPVDLYGQMADRTAFCEIAEQHNLGVIWDAAQAIGAGFDGKPIGAFPGASTLSFYPTKNLGAYGDGGMALTSDEQIRDRLRQFRFHGSGGGYFYAKIGYCSRLDALQAAILRAKLVHLNDWNDLRRKHAEIYRDRLAGACVTLPYCDRRAHHTYHQFTLRHPRRDALKRHLAKNDVDSGIYYPLALHLQEAYSYLGHKPGDFPEAERATAEVLSIPVYPELSEEQIAYVAGLIHEFDR
jgi:dTDP-4-amino-4,6-dideoxygalactose transaminase